jgi:hypothetical protein
MKKIALVFPQVQVIAAPAVKKTALEQCNTDFFFSIERNVLSVNIHALIRLQRQPMPTYCACQHLLLNFSLMLLALHMIPKKIYI